MKLPGRAERKCACAGGGKVGQTPVSRDPLLGAPGASRPGAAGRRCAAGRRSAANVSGGRGPRAPGPRGLAGSRPSRALRSEVGRASKPAWRLPARSRSDPQRAAAPSLTGARLAEALPAVGGGAWPFHVGRTPRSLLGPVCEGTRINSGKRTVSRNLPRPGIEPVSPAPRG